MMKKSKAICFICITLLVLTAFLTYAEDTRTNNLQKIIRFKEDVDSKAIEDFIQANDLELIEKLPLINAIVVSKKASKLSILKNSKLVASFEKNNPVRLIEPISSDEQKENKILSQTIPWGIEKVKASTVWSNYQGEGINVGVIDTGIDMDHEDLKDNIKGGYNCIADNDNFDDDHSHGTHVAGTIAALDNGYGVVGVAPKASLYGIKVLDGNGSGTISSVVKGIEWAVNNNMDVINMSLGSSESSDAIKAACDKAYQKGVIVVAAAGNSYNEVGYPARYDNVICVGATNVDDLVEAFSCRGPGLVVDVAAPGKDVLSTVPPTGWFFPKKYKKYSGTSMASPHVAGVVTLILESGKAYTLEGVRNVLSKSSFDIYELGKDEVSGWGIVNVKDALGFK